jgi:PAS domain S-box-containing protein
MVMADKACKALLIEDNAGDARMIEVLLSQAQGQGFELRSADRLSAGLDQLSVGDVNIILLDLSLPDSEGLATLEQVHAKAPDVPIVVITGHDDEELAIHSVQRGADDYLVKGRLDGDVLVRTMRYAIERKQSAETLRLTQFSVDRSVEAIFWIGPEARILQVNEAACRALGYSRKELLAMTVHDIDPQFPAEIWGEHWENLKRRGSLVIETYHRTKDDRTFPVEVAANYIQFGGKEYNCAFARDISERKRSELALRLSEQRFRAIADYTYFWEVWVSSEGRVLWTNAAVERITGYSAQEMTSMRDYPMPLFCEEDRQRAKAAFESALKGSSGQEVEFRLRRKDGTVIWAEVSWQPIYDDKGISQGHRASIRDISKRKHAAEALGLIMEGTASATGEDFFRCLVKALASAFEFRYAFVGDLIGSKKNRIRTLAVWADGEYAEDFEYDLAGTPCHGVVGRELCFHADGVQKQFPEDHLLVELAVESYLGAPLFDSGGRPLGLLAVMDNKPMERTPRNEAILTIFASRAAAELEREAVSRALASSEKRFRSVAETASDAIISADFNGEIVFWNDAAEKVFGYSAVEIIGKPLTTIMPDRYHRAHQKGLNRVVQTGKSRLSGKAVELAGLRKDGSEFPVSISAASWATKEGLFFTAIIRDITVRKQAEDALRQSEQMLQSVLDTIPARVFWKDRDSVFIGCNKLFAQDAGLESPDEIVGKNDFEVGWRDQAESYRSDDAEVIRTGIPKVKYEEPQTTPDGKQSWLSTSKIPLRDVEGNIIGVLGTYEDITSRKRVEQALRTSEANYREIFNSVNDLIVVHDIETGRIVDANQKMLDTFGYSREEMQGLDVKDISAPQRSYSQSQATKHLKAAAQGKPQLFEWLCRNRSGRVFWVEVSLRRAVIGDQKRVLAVVRDITERKEAEQEIREREQKYRELVETMNEGLGLADADYVLTYVNNRFAEMLGYSPEEMVGRHLTEFLDERGKEIMTAQMGNRREGTAKPYDLEWVAKDGRKVYTIASPKGIFDSEGNFKGSFGVLTDITDRKLAEQARDRLYRELESKNKELESILYAASHDLRSPLVNIQGFSNELSRNCETIRSALVENKIADGLDRKVRAALDEAIPEALGFVLTSAGKMDSLLSGLLRLCRLGQTAINTEWLDMNAMMTEIVGGIEYQLKEAGAKVEMQSLPGCYGDAWQMNQVFSNLVDNAVNYLDESRSGLIRIFARREANRNIYCVQDNGVGIAADHQDNIFEIFHRLVPDKGRGEGLGLTIVRRILDRHNGKIWVESQVGKGSSFFVSLPSD